MIFILGIERSATTWVSNLIDAHPAARVYVEPVSAFTSHFNHWPNRFEEIDDLEAKAAYFKKEFEIIKQRKNWLLTRFLQSQRAWKADLGLAKFLIRKKLATDAVNDFYEINFHRKNLFEGKKQKKAKIEAVKELRLNFNAAIIPYIDANARVIVVLREAAANIQSILKHINRDGLAELKQLLLEHYGEVNEVSVFKYWRDSYNRLLYQLERDGTPHLTVFHNDLISDSEATVKAVCDFIGLNNSAPVMEYFHQSNRKGKGLHNTNRNHGELLEQKRRARDKIYPEIKNLLAQSDFHPKFKKGDQ